MLSDWIAICEPLEAAPAGHHVRAGLGELDGNGPADSLAGAGHDRDAILQHTGGKVSPLERSGLE